MQLVEFFKRNPIFGPVACRLVKVSPFVLEAHDQIAFLDSDVRRECILSTQSGQFAINMEAPPLERPLGLVFQPFSSSLFVLFSNVAGRRLWMSERHLALC